MKTEQKIIKLFLEKPGKYTIKESSGLIKADYKIVHTAMTRLKNKGIISFIKVGKSNLCIFNYKLSEEVMIEEIRRKNDILRKSDILVMHNTIIEKLDTCLYVLLLFGSYAKKKQTKHSDIDLMFIVPDKIEIENKIDNLISLLPLNIHHLVFTESEFIGMKDAKASNVVKEAIQNNIIIHGIEDYYYLRK